VAHSDGFQRLPGTTLQGSRLYGAYIKTPNNTHGLKCA